MCTYSVLRSSVPYEGSESGMGCKTVSKALGNVKAYVAQQ